MLFRSRDRVFQCQRVQTKLITQTLHSLAVRGFQFNPDKAVWLINVVTDISKINVLEFRIVEEEAVDDGTRLKKVSR